MKIFFSNYHVSVNNCFVDDCLAIGHEVVVPTESFAKDHISFFAPNNEHYSKPGVVAADYNNFLQMPPMVLIINCSQMYDDMMNLYRARNEVDTLVMLSSQPGMGEWVDAKPDWHSDYLISHSLIWHRKSKAKYKIFYFNRPKQLESPKTKEEMLKTFKEKKIKLYINHFETATNYMTPRSFVKEFEAAKEFREIWQVQTGYKIPFYGYENIDGQLSMEQTQKEIKDSIFTLAFKAHETWGQMVNESMLISTPCIFLKPFIVDMFTEYLITKDTAIIGETVTEVIKTITNMTFEEYETLSVEAQKMSQMFTEEANRRSKLAWLFGKITL